MTESLSSKRPRSLPAVLALARREWTRFIRQRNRVFGALVQPLIFWALFGAGLSASFRPQGPSNPVGYVEYFLPGTIILVVLFTAIFATISTIEDRNEGLLQSVLVAPIAPSAIVLGKLAGTTLLAVGQAALLFLAIPVAGFAVSPMGALLSLALLVVIGFGLAGLGFAIAWRMDSTQGFHAIMTAFLLPMWFLSGAFFPPEGVPAWMSLIMRLNPVTYALAALRRLLYIDRPELAGALPGLAVSVAVTLVFAVAMVWLSSSVVRRSRFVA